VRFDVYKIDYGCHVDLINTTKAPRGLFQMDEGEEFTEVPGGDYRSIRLAILLPDDPRTLVSVEDEASVVRVSSGIEG
jgi:hypothetical protein